MFQALPSSEATVLSETLPALPATVVNDAESMSPEFFKIEVMVAEQLPTSIHAPYMSISLPLCKREYSSTTARSPKNRRLDTATAPATVVVKEEDFLDVTPRISTTCHSRMWPTRKYRYKQMKTVCCDYTEDFQNLRETHELYGGEDLGKNVDLLLCNPPYNVCRQQDLQNSNHDFFIAKETTTFPDFAGYVLRVEGTDIAYVLPHSSSPGERVCALAWKRRRTVLGKLR